MSGVISVQCGSLTWLFVLAGFRGPRFERNTCERVGETHEWLYKLESLDDIPFLSVEITELSGGRILYQTSQISHDNLEISLPL